MFRPTSLLAALTVLFLAACTPPSTSSDAGQASDAGHASDAGAQADAGVDAGTTTTKVTVSATGGTLEAPGIRLDVRAGAVASAVELEVQRTTEVPTLAGVTPLTPVFDFGPDGTQFASEVAVTFTLATAAVGAELPLVYWTQADGTFAPLPTWWGADGRVHALTTHLSKAFVGRAATEPDSLRCCGGVACAGRGVCLARTPLIDTKLATDTQVAAVTGATVQLATVQTAGVLRAVTQRATPVRPFDEALPFVGAVFDLQVTPFAAGETATLCVTVPPGTTLSGTCLAFFDEGDSKWKCQDPCVSQKGDQLCGKTDHFTSFAILLTGGRTDAECGR